MLKRKWFVKREWFNRGIRETLKHVIIVTVAFLLVVSPFSWYGNMFIQKASSAGTFQVQTGTYIGTGATQSITGLGFQPELVIIKSATTAGVSAFKTSAMPATDTQFFSASNINTASQIQFDVDGFTIGTLANLNSLNVQYFWIAFAGSDCTATGVFCVGRYTGNGAASQTINTGFQPDFVTVKRTTNVASNFRTSLHPLNRSSRWINDVDLMSGAGINSFNSTGFEVGLTLNNVNGGIYDFFAFKNTTGLFSAGSYVGDAVDNRNITGVGFKPNMVMVKNSTNAAGGNMVPYMSFDYNYGDHAVGIGTTAAATVNIIQELQSDGFQLGTSVFSNGAADTYYYIAFGGVPPLPSGTGSFEFAYGTYDGNLTERSITGLGFKPDLVLIKPNTNVLGTFKTKHMKGQLTAYTAGSTGNIATGAITSLDVDGFSLGTSTVINNTGVTYQWQAFGNAYDIEKKTGGGDFIVGFYTGNTITNRKIILPFQPAFVLTKRSGLVSSFKTSVHTGEVSSLLSAAVDTATENIKALDTDGFMIGTGASNSSSSIYYYFAFKDNPNINIGTYTGNGLDNRNFTSVGFQPDLVWIKRTTAVASVQRPASLIGDVTQYFANTANVNNRIQELLSDGFQLGTGNEVNANTGSYYYIAWKKPINTSGSLNLSVVDAGGNQVINPSLIMDDVDFVNTSQISSAVLGVADQKIRVQNTTTNPAWTVSIAATSGSTALWDSGTHQYDFNDDTFDAVDGVDSDSVGGQMSFEPTTGTITPQSGCTTTGVSLGSLASFVEGSQDSITLISGSGSAETNCYWDVTGITVEQSIPESQEQGVYTLPMTLTIVAN